MCVAPKVMYWSLRNWLMNFATHWGLQVELVDMTRPGRGAARAIRPGTTKLVWIETPANPLWTVTDIAAAADIAHRAGALLAVDSTVATPVLTRPHRARRRHRHAFGDQVPQRPLRRDRRRAGRRARRRLLASASSRCARSSAASWASFEAWLLLRGMRTLYPARAPGLALGAALAEHFAAHPAVEAVLYPGLPGFAGHAVAARQMTGGFGGMLSMRVKGGERAAIATAARVELWKRATSLGGVESLIEHRASVEGAGHALPARPAAPVGRHRGQRRPDRRPRAGAARRIALNHAARCS